MKIKLIGDTHGNYEELVRLQKGADYSIALGDIGFNYHNLTELYKQGNIDPHRNFMFAGNHDNYPLLEINPPEYFLKERFGVFVIENKTFLYVSGGWSIDWKRRTPEFDWFADEELSEQEFKLAKEEYVQFKPDVLLTHEGPLRCVPFVTNPAFAQRFGYPATIHTRTTVFLQSLLESFSVDRWFFAHYHCTGGRQFTIDGFPTEFVHLDMIRFNERGFIYPGSTYDLEI